jgi:hypothetical protein
VRQRRRVADSKVRQHGPEGGVLEGTGVALLDEAADVGDDRIALVGPLDDAVLHVDDQECGVRPVLECGHVQARWTSPLTAGRPTMA